MEDTNNNEISLDINKETNDVMADLNDFEPMYNKIEVDCTKEFTTNEIFVARQTFEKWARQVAYDLGIVLTVKSSNCGSGTLPRLRLMCERGGKYRQGRKNVCSSSIAQGHDISNEIDGRRDTGTKKCDCPFEIVGKESKEGVWQVRVLNGVHNHPIGHFLIGHSIAGRLTHVEKKLVTDLSKNNTRPKDILATLQETHRHNKSTMKTIYNARYKERIVEHAGRSQMQYLLAKLKEHDYFYHHKRCEVTDIVKCLFYAHLTSVNLLRAFPNVLLMDCTYKTNRYKMPLLEIVGVTSTNMTFSVACVYMEGEKEENYLWACNTLKGLMDKHCLPTVFVTDRELALVRALKASFPYSAHLLCRWHINRNILAKCKKLFRTKAKWESFNYSWNSLMLSNDVAQFEEHKRRFEADFSDYRKVVEYAINNWIQPYKENFVSCWTNQIMHFGNTTTNRAESTHAKLKKQLGTSQGTFETSWKNIHTLLITSHNAVKASFTKSINIVLHKYRSPALKIIRGMVSHKALSLLVDELKAINRCGFDISLCGCVLRKTCGLPCAHELAEYARDGQYVPLESIDRFWRKLDMESIPGVDVDVGDDIGCRWTETIDDINNLFTRANESERLLMLKRLREVANPSTTSLNEPEVPIKSKGRPKGAKNRHLKSTKREPSEFEYVNQSTHDSNSHVEENIYFSGHTSHIPHFSATKRQKKSVVQRSIGHSTSIENIDNLLPHIRPFVSATVNVKADGNCGFRVIAAQLGMGEEKWIDVRRELLKELLTFPELYRSVFLEDVLYGKTVNSLNFFRDDVGAPLEHWFEYPTMTHLVASAYNVALVHISPQACFTFTPLRTAPPADPKLICLAHINGNHFIQVMFNEGSPLPPIIYICQEFRLAPAVGWDKVYEERLFKYKEIVPDKCSQSYNHPINLGD